MTVREVLKILAADGWKPVPGRTKGSHMQLKNKDKLGTVTVPMHGGDLKPGTLNSIMKQAGLK